MKKILILTFCYFASTLASAQGNKMIALVGEGRNNVMQNWEVTPEKWNAQVKWSPTSSNQPPFSIAKPIQVAENWLHKQHPDIKKLSLYQVTLRQPMQAFIDDDSRWFYKIEFQPIVAGRKLWGGDFTAVVLFDGTVVVPRSEKYK
jgi:hypothetical protein